MRAKDTNIRLRRFELNKKRQTVADLETMIADFRRMADDLNRQIEIEEKRSGIRDVNHFAYPTFAKSAVRRRENLFTSIANLEGQLETAHTELADTLLDVSKFDTSERVIPGLALVGA
ncbi:MAG: flagellar export protein FliJ [Hyphomicrobiales bacterium]|nr:flagellar export protein FliJ [Hyphomicrobiales bacterium]